MRVFCCEIYEVLIRFELHIGRFASNARVQSKSNMVCERNCVHCLEMKESCKFTTTFAMRMHIGHIHITLRTDWE